MLDGRVKTLHPKVHGGLLARRDLPEHMAALQAHGIDTIDLLVVNLYPFEATVARPGCTLEDAIENIDIGGPAMVRSAAKNWKDVGVLTDASQYAPVLAELQRGRQAVGQDALRAVGGGVQPHQRLRRRHQRLSLAHPGRTRSQPGAGSQPGAVRRPGQRPLRQGAGPALRREPAPAGRVLPRPVPRARLAGDGAGSCRARSFPTTTSPMPTPPGNASRASTTPACVIVKHANPCGVAAGPRSAGGLRQGLPDRPDLRLRRHHRLQPRRSTARPRRRSPSSSSRC